MELDSVLIGFLAGLLLTFAWPKIPTLVNSIKHLFQREET